MSRELISVNILFKNVVQTWSLGFGCETPTRKLPVYRLWMLELGGSTSLDFVLDFIDFWMDEP